jgi:hypothetical protein
VKNTKRWSFARNRRHGNERQRLEQRRADGRSTENDGGGAEGVWQSEEDSRHCWEGVEENECGF